MGLLSLLSLNTFGASELKPGQIWEYKTRKGEESSRITILKIEPDDKNNDRIIHLSISGLKMKSTLDGLTRIVDTLGHIPTSEKVIKPGLVKLIGNTRISEDMLEGIKQWKSAKGGIWTLSLAQTISTIEEGMNKK